MPLPLFSSTPLSTIEYTIAIAAGKGGVGKSTVAVNTALALTHAGYRVGFGYGYLWTFSQENAS